MIMRAQSGSVIFSAHVLEEFGDDFIGGLPLCVGLKAADHSVPQDQRGERGYVFAGDIKAACAGSAGAAGHDQILAGARAGAPANPSLYIIGSTRISRPGG